MSRQKANWDEIVRLTKMGYTSTQISERLRCCKRTVNRARAAGGVSDPRGLRRMSEAQAALALRLLEDGASYSEVARTIGFAQTSVSDRFPGYGMKKGPYWALELKRMKAI